MGRVRTEQPFFQSNRNEVLRALAKDAAGSLALILLFSIFVFIFFDGRSVAPESSHSLNKVLTKAYFFDSVFVSPLTETAFLAAFVSLFAIIAGFVTQRPRAFQIAIVISAILFALAHATFRQGYGLLTLWPAFVMANLYAKFAQHALPIRGLCLATVVHSLHNLTVFLILFLAQVMI